MTKLTETPGGPGAQLPMVEEVDNDQLFLALFDTTPLWVGLCSRGESYRKVQFILTSNVIAKNRRLILNQP